MYGESLDCSNFDNGLLTTKAELLTQYFSKDIFNADETTFFYRIQVGKSFVGPNEKHEGGNVDKTRVTLLVACSAEGKKLPLLCIGKAKKPQWPVVMGRK